MPRGRGVGSAGRYKIKNGYRYKAVVEMYGRKYTEGGFLTATSARERAWQMRRELEEGTYERPADKAKRLRAEAKLNKAATQTVEAYADAWLDELRKLADAGQMSANTVRAYKSVLKVHIKPGFAGMTMREVTPRDVQTWRSRILSNRSASTAANCYRALSSMMNHAVDAGVIPASPCKVKGAFKAPTSSHEREQHYFTHDEYQALYEALRASDQPSYAAIAALLYYTACRPSEARALRVGDVDLKRNRVKYSAALQRSETGEMIEGPTKTKRVRYAPIPAPLRKVLEPLIKGRKAGEWLFLAPKKKSVPPSDKQVTLRMRKALDSIGLQDAELYDLKHTCLTNLGRAGASLKELMDLPGHTQIETVLKYQLADFDRVASAVERMVERLED